jgi:RimJ/RimL family protein N-acetyltransferase
MNPTVGTGQPEEVRLQPLTPDDVVAIRAWPPYTGEFAPLDYALRPGGWLDAFPESMTTRRLGIWSDGMLVGFSLLTDIKGERAEFYIAIHPQETGRGIGRLAIPKVLAIAFNDLRLQVVFLKVRVWHHHGIALYERMGFVATGEITEDVQGRPERFLKMEVRAKGPRLV